MKVLVCGGRAYGDGGKVREVLSAFHAAQPIARLIEGGARGADRLARLWARDTGVDFETYGADWAKHGRAAGPIRNQQMLDEGQAWKSS